MKHKRLLSTYLTFLNVWIYLKRIYHLLKIKKKYSKNKDMCE